MLPIWGQNVLFGVSSVAIFFLAPIDTPNRRVDSVEYQVYRKRTIGVLGIEVILYLVLQIINFQQEASAVFIAVFQEMMFLCMGKQEGVFDK